MRTQKSKSPALGQGPVPPKRQQILGKAKKLVHACPETAISMGSTHLNRKCWNHQNCAGRKNSESRSLCTCVRHSQVKLEHIWTPCSWDTASCDSFNLSWHSNISTGCKIQLHQILTGEILMVQFNAITAAVPQDVEAWTCLCWGNNLDCECKHGGGSTRVPPKASLDYRTREHQPETPQFSQLP